MKGKSLKPIFYLNKDGAEVKTSYAEICCAWERTRGREVEIICGMYGAYIRISQGEAGRNIAYAMSEPQAWDAFCFGGFGGDEHEAISEFPYELFEK